MSHTSIAKSALVGAITFALSQPVLAVTDEEFKTLQEQFNQLADQVEENSKSSTSNTTVGGYGELHYNNLSNGKGTDKKVLDLHRFVVFINHDFNDDIRLFTEFEIEHAFVSDNNDGSGDTSPGEVEVEQMFVGFPPLGVGCLTRFEFGRARGLGWLVGLWCGRFFVGFG